MSERISLEEQEISLDIYDSAIEKIGEKILKPERREEFLSKWAYRPTGIKKFPPMSSGLTIAYKNKNKADTISEGFLASLMCLEELSAKLEPQIYELGFLRDEVRYF